MPETFWITTNVGTVREARPKFGRGETYDNLPDGELVNLGREYADYQRIGRDCFRSEAKAMADAERRKAKKIASLRKQIEKLETTPIKVVRLSPDSPAAGEDA